jgi:nicotinate-nucleotide adenylyltransferase
MLHLAIDPLDWAALSDWELDRPEPSFSWQAVDHFSNLWGNPARLGWILGADQWHLIESWARPDHLAARLEFLVFPRAGAPIAPKPGFRHTVVDVLHPASSTAVREAVRHRRPLDALVPPPVADYIARNRLYLDSPPPPGTG